MNQGSALLFFRVAFEQPYPDQEIHSKAMLEILLKSNVQPHKRPLLDACKQYTCLSPHVRLILSGPILLISRGKVELNN